jgi:hypothetical protein
MRASWVVAVAIWSSGCGPLRVDALVAEAARNEVSALRTARGREVEASGRVVEVLAPSAAGSRRKRGDKLDLGHREAVQLVSEAGTLVTCYLAPNSRVPLAPGAVGRLLGRFYDFEPGEDGKASIVLVRCHEP